MDRAGLASLNLNSRSLRWPKKTETHGGCCCSGRRLCRGDRERLDMKVTRTSCVIEHCHTDVAFTDNRRDLCQRHVEPSCLRELRREKAELYFAGCARLRMKMNSENRSIRRMAFEIELQQF